MLVASEKNIKPENRANIFSRFSSPESYLSKLSFDTSSAPLCTKLNARSIDTNPLSKINNGSFTNIADNTNDAKLMLIDATV